MRPSTMRPRRGVSNSSATGSAESGTTSTVTGTAAARRQRHRVSRRRAAREREREGHDGAGEGLAGGERTQFDAGQVAERVDERRGDEPRQHERRDEAERERIVERGEQRHPERCQKGVAAPRRQDVDPAMTQDDGIVIGGCMAEEPLQIAGAPRPRGSRCGVRQGGRGRRRGHRHVSNRSGN